MSSVRSFPRVYVTRSRVTQVTTPVPARTVLRRAALAAGGGVIGTAARLAIGMLVPDATGGVLIANITGALLLGVLTARLTASDLRIFLGTGVLGGFTTYSAFTVGAVGLWVTAPFLAVGYAVVSVVLGLAAAAIGLRLGARRRQA